MNKRRRTVGLVVDQISSLVDHDFFQNIVISGVTDVLRRKDMNLLVFVVGKIKSPYAWENSRNILMEFIRSDKLDGLIVLSTAIAGYADKQSIGKLIKSYRNIPIVSIGETYETIPSVVSGGYDAMREMVDHLIEVHGKRKFVFIKGPDGGHESEIRLAALLDSLAAHGIPFDPERMYTGSYLYESGHAAIRYFHERGIEYDALVSSNDDMALGAIKELKQLYGYLPPDLAIVGYDDAVYAHPLGLTTVRQDFRLQAQQAAEIVCRLMDGEETDIRHELSNKLVIRSSCGCVPPVVVNTFRPMGESRSDDGVSAGEGTGVLSGEGAGDRYGGNALGGGASAGVMPDGDATEGDISAGDALAVRNAPVGDASSGDALADRNAPVGDASSGDALAVRNAPVGDASSGDALAVRNAPVGDASSGDAHADRNAPVGDASSGDAHADRNAPVGDASSGDALADRNAPVGDASSGDALADRKPPVGISPAWDASPGDSPSAIAGFAPAPATFAGRPASLTPGNIDRRMVEWLKQTVLREIREIGLSGFAGFEEDGERTGRQNAGEQAEEAPIVELREMLAVTLVDSILSGESLPFYRTMERYMTYLRDTGRPLIRMHDWLSRIREKTLARLPQHFVPFAEDLFHAARAHISDALGKSEASRYFLSSLQSAQLEQFSEELFSALDVREQMKQTADLLTKHGIRYAFVALYEDPARPMDESRLMLEIQDGKWVDLGDGVVFPTMSLLPDPVIRKMEDQRLDLVVQVLFHSDTRLGYTVFSFDDRVTRYYEVINNRLSIALKNVKHVMEEQNYRQNLELQVAKRTKELTDANAKLREEIAKRQEAEDKLRKALEELAALNVELHAISIRDELTGLLNRRGFMEQSKISLRRFAKNGQTYLVMFADMDNLKKINDRYGHGEGDLAIVETAKLLRASLPAGSVLARMGGDEFTAVIPVNENCREATDAVQNRISDQFAAFNRSSAKDYELSISLGFACHEDGCNNTFNELMILADNRLYEQKAAKRRA